MRFCEVQQCNKPVWGTDKLTRTGYCKSHQHLRTDIDKDTIIQKAIKRQRIGAALKTGRQLRKLATTEPNVREGSKKVETKSQLLREADRVFGDWVKNRDADSEGKIQCPCCCKFFNLADTDKDGNKIVQPLHFVSRKIYNHRFNELQVWSGDSYCNLDMHLNPKGRAYQGYRRFMVNLLGEEEVAELEIAHRQINKITEQQLRTVIEHYSNQPLNTEI